MIDSQDGGSTNNCCDDDDDDDDDATKKNVLPPPLVSIEMAMMTTTAKRDGAGRRRRRWRQFFIVIDQYWNLMLLLLRLRWKRMDGACSMAILLYVAYDVWIWEDWALYASDISIISSRIAFHQYELWSSFVLLWSFATLRNQRTRRRRRSELEHTKYPKRRRLDGWQSNQVRMLGPWCRCMMLWCMHAVEMPR